MITLHLPKINKHVTTVALVIVVALSLISYGAVKAEQIHKHNQAVAAQTKAAQEQLAKEQAAKLANTQAAVTALTQQATSSLRHTVILSVIYKP
jgi:uncharacterized protein HemX